MIAEDLGAIGRSEDRLGDVAADLAGVDVERRRNFHVADVVSAELAVHQPGHRLVGARIAVIGKSLHERGGAISHADNADTHRLT